MKSKHRTHHSRIEVETVHTTQHDFHIEVCVSFRFDPWDNPLAYPAGYAADALLTFQSIWDAGLEALELKDSTEAGTCVRLEHTHTFLRVHDPVLCEGRFCTVHNRSEHDMRSFPQHWRSDLALMERTCPHGVGHPDPDERHRPSWTDGKEVHGCDGCCVGEIFEDNETNTNREWRAT